MRTGQMKGPLEWYHEPGAPHVALRPASRAESKSLRKWGRDNGARWRFGHVYYDAGVWHAMGTTFEQCRDFDTLEEAKIFIEALYALD